MTFYFEKALKSFRYPQVWWALISPIILSTLLSAIFIYFFIAPIFESFSFSVLQTIVNGLQSISLVPESVLDFLNRYKDQIVQILFVIILFLTAFPFFVVLTTVISSLMANIYLIPFLGEKEFSFLEKKGSSRFFGSIYNTIKYSVLFLIFWGISLPFFLFLPFMPIMTMLLTGWYFHKISSYDILTLWANDKELSSVKDQNYWKAFLICFLVSGLQFIPLAFAFAPVLIQIVLIYFYLDQLQIHRQA